MCKVLLISFLGALLLTLAAAGPATRHGKLKQLHTSTAYEDDIQDEHMHPEMEPSLTRKLDGEETIEYWLENGAKFVKEKVKSADAPQRGIAKNIIFFLGDGMSFATIAATRVYLGGEEESLSFEEFPYTGLAKTYALDRLIPDSACTATAFLCGVKARHGTIGVNGHVKRADCTAAKNTQYYVDSIAKWALQKGKSVGLVTTSRVTHATPAGLYAHTSERDWENDAQVKRDCGSATTGIQDIALQLINGEVGKKLSVVFGGGRAQFISTKDSAVGQRTDGRNLLNEFASQGGNVYISTKQQLQQLYANQGAKRVLGLFNDDHLLYNLEADRDAQPTLSEMTTKAIELLSTNTAGYLLFVEGGKIDEAHHANMARLALDETAEFSKAVGLARSATNIADTLMVVSADHSHTMSLAGYASRSNEVFGVAAVGTDDLPYLTLSYANGPSYDHFFDMEKNKRKNIAKLFSSIDSIDIFPATVPLQSETHAGEDVVVYASGPWSQLFSGAYEQSTIPHLMAFAACLGDGLKACS